MENENEQGDRSATIRDEAMAWFLRLSDADVTPTERARFETWRRADPAHDSTYDEISRLWTDVGPLEEAFSPEAEADAAMRSKFRRRMALGGLAAACAALLAVGTSDMGRSLFADHSTAPGQQAQVTLPDGSVAYLNTDTALDVAYAGDRREVVLRSGEALFSVRKDPRRPFSVAANGGRSTALGTVFSVRDLGDTTRVTVVEGTVRVEAPAAPNSPQESSRVVLKAAQQVSYRDGTPPGPVRRVDAATATAWRDGTIVLDKVPLAAAIAEIDRYRPGRILVLFGARQLQPVTARLSIAHLDGGLEALVGTHGLSVTRITDYLLIVH